MYFAKPSIVAKNIVSFEGLTGFFPCGLLIGALNPPLLPQHEQIQAFNLVSCPRGLAQELQTGTDARV